MRIKYSLVVKIEFR